MITRGHGTREAAGDAYAVAMTLRQAGVTIGTVTMLLVAGCSTTKSTATRLTGRPGGTTACTYLAAEHGRAAPGVGRPPAIGVPKSGERTLTLTLGQGVVTIKLDTAMAPCSVNSLTYLAGKRFYDNTVCHRATGTILQCGDPSGTGEGGPGYRFASENVPPASDPDGSVEYLAGTVGLANSNLPDSNGSQFFLMTKGTRFLAGYPIVGVVTGGLDVLERITAAGNDDGNPGGGGKPNQEVRITSLTVR